MLPFKPLVTSVLLLASLATLAQAADSKVDGEGFVRDWLLLAPFSLPEDSGPTAIELTQIAKEGELRPKAGDLQKIGEQEVAWRVVKGSDFSLDVHAALGERHEDALAYLVSYIVADQDMSGLTLAIGSNDQARIWINGKQVHTATDGRGLEQDNDLIPGVELKKGVNTVVFKLINMKNDWAAALRFRDKDDKVVTGLTVKTAL